ncbi:MAG TPA: hypothetical protein VFU98_00515 [Microlunatus sp.]|nr:hypothetical protein [Microlunatus sp.]
MKTPAAAVVVRGLIRCVLMTCGVVLGLLLAAGPAQADSPLDLGTTVDKVTKTVHKATSTAKKASRSAREVTTPRSGHKATKPVRQVTKTVRRATKPSREITEPVRKITKPVRKITSQVRKITKTAGQATKPARHATHRDRDKVTRPKPETTPTRSERATKPEPASTSKVSTRSQARATSRAATQQSGTGTLRTAPATSPSSTTGDLTGTVSRVVERTPALIASATRTTADLLVIEDALVDTTSGMLSTAGQQLPEPLSNLIRDSVVAPVDTIHDAALLLVDEALTITVPSVAEHVTEALLPVLDEVGEAQPPHAASPGPPSTPAVPLRPGFAVGPVGSPPAESVSAAQLSLDDASGATARSSVLSLEPGLLGGALVGAPQKASGSSPRSTVATRAGLLLGAAHSLQEGLVGVGPSGSATAMALGLSLLALASTGAFGPGTARLVRVVGLQHRQPYRRAHRPGFSPD